MTFAHSTRMRSYGEVSGDGRWDVVPFSQPAQIEQENTFYAPKFSMSVAPAQQVVVYVASAPPKAEFSTVHYGELGQHRGLPREKIPTSSCALFESACFRGSLLNDGLDALLTNNRAREDGDTLDKIIGAIEGLHSFPKMEGHQEKMEREEIPYTRSIIDAGFLPVYSIPGKESDNKRRQNQPPDVAQEERGKYLGKPLAKDDKLRVDEGTALGKKSHQSSASGNHYGKLSGYGGFRQKPWKGAETEGKYDFRQVWSNIEVSYSFTIGKNDNTFSHYIDYDSLRPKTHGSTLIKARSSYHWIRRQMCIYASFEAYFG